MLKDNDEMLNEAMLANIEWQIKTISDDINNKLQQITVLEEKEEIIKHFSGNVCKETLIALLAFFIITKILSLLSLSFILNFNFSIPVIALSLSIGVWFRIRKDYIIIRDTNYTNLVNEIRNLKKNISNLNVKKMQLLEIRYLMKLRDKGNQNLNSSILPINRYYDNQVADRKRSLYKSRH